MNPHWSIRPSELDGYRRVGKRVIDLVFSVAALVFLFPVMALVAILVWLNLGSPVLFRQARSGLHGKPFVLLKFRTMTDTRDDTGNLLPDAQRLTRLGRFLRSSSLDELPELLNVLRGEMSLVGPRPLLVDYLPYYTVREQHRHCVLPGITGLAQVRGRNRLPWEERLELDVQYVEQQSLLLDMRILWETLWKVLFRRDIMVIPGVVQGRLDKCRQAQEHGDRRP